VEHHHAAGRVWQRGDEIAVVATRRHAGDRPGCVAAEAVADEPLLARLRVDVTDGVGSGFVHGSTGCFSPLTGDGSRWRAAAGSGAHNTAACAGIASRATVNGSGVPWPP